MANQDRERSNMLRSAEHRLVQYLCARLPQWVTPDMLTAFGFFGSLVICAGLWWGERNRFFLLLSIVGLAIHWFGDSLDGRLAYYRNRPRKWYGWALDINADWTSACIIGLGFYFYLPVYKIMAALFVVIYGGAMIIALLRYKITNKYQIDSFYFGPTELRLLIAAVLLVEIFRPGALLHFSVAGSLLLVIFNLFELCRLLRLGDEKDRAEKAKQSLGVEPALN
jgi:phosphatidylglycerophosphate synthase